MRSCAVHPLCQDLWHFGTEAYGSDGISAKSDQPESVPTTFYEQKGIRSNRAEHHNFET